MLGIDCATVVQHSADERQEQYPGCSPDQTRSPTSKNGSVGASENDCSSRCYICVSEKYGVAYRSEPAFSARLPDESGIGPKHKEVGLHLCVVLTRVHEWAAQVVKSIRSVQGEGGEWIETAKG